MKHFTRLICLFAAALMVFSAVSCGSTETDDDTETTAAAAGTTAEEVTTSNLDKNGFLLDDLPELNYNGDTVSFLYWSDVQRPEFEIKEEDVSGSIVEEAIYNRNMQTEERLGIKIEWHGEKGNNDNINSFTTFVTNCYNGGNFYDIVATYSRSAAACTTRGLYTDLNTIDGSYFNFEKPWWPNTMYDACTIGNSLYFISGDISTNVLHFMYGVYYNMDLLKNLNLEDPVKYVDDMTWTIDKMIGMSSGLYQDLDQSGKQSDLDFYGFCTQYFHLDAFYTGSGMRLVEDDPDELLIISPDFTSEKCVDMVAKLGDWLTTSSCYVSGGRLGSVSYQVPFASGNALFCLNRVYMADALNASKLHDVKWTYSIVPTPLYDADQENYVTVIGNPFTLYGIMQGISDENLIRNSAVIECLASKAYRLTTPALFETNMKYRYTNEERGDAVRMFDIIHDTIDFDLGRIFAYALSGMSEMPSKAAAKGTSWGATMKAQDKTLRTDLASKVVGPLRALNP